MDVVELGTVCDIIGGGTPSKANPEYWNGDIRWASVRDMKSSTIESTEFKISSLGLSNSSSNLIPGQNVIIASRVGLGKVCWINEDTAINQDLRAIIPNNPDKLTKKYLFWWLRFSSKQIIDAGQGATVQGVTLPFLKGLKLKLPPINEQHQIVTRLENAFAKIEKAIEITKYNEKNAESLYISIARAALSSAEGQDKKVGDILTLEYGKPLDKADRTQDGMFAAYGANGVKDRTDKFYWDQPSIIVGRKGSAGELTKVTDPFWPLDVTYYVVHDSSETNIDYIYSLLKSLDLTSFARGVKPGINRNDIYQLDVKVPDLRNQDEIAKKIDLASIKSMQLKKLYNSRLKLLDDLKYSLLAEAFSESAVK